MIIIYYQNLAVVRVLGPLKQEVPVICLAIVCFATQ